MITKETRYQPEKKKKGWGLGFGRKANRMINE